MRDKRMYWTRNRHFRQGRQWISSRDGRTYRELEPMKNTLRMTLDLTSPALDFRLLLDVRGNERLVLNYSVHFIPPNELSHRTEIIFVRNEVRRPIKHIRGRSVPPEDPRFRRQILIFDTDADDVRVSD